jgi:polysaccharide deacetylase 2 family uncharacterized protein YibQ
MAKSITTLNCPGLTTLRSDGNTERQVEFAIKQITEGTECIVQDHYEEGSNVKANRSLLRRILESLKLKYNLDEKSLKIVIGNTISIRII